jgi:hypothetical protein
MQYLHAHRCPWSRQFLLSAPHQCFSGHFAIGHRIDPVEEALALRWICTNPFVLIS